MNSLEQKTITSIEVAEMIGKEHSNLLKDIRRYIEQSAEVKINLGEFFKESSYQDANNQKRPCFDVTIKGCEFIANKLTGPKGIEFTAKYINKFHDMEETIKTGLLDNLSTEMQALIMHDKKIQAVVEHINKHDGRLDKLENTMVIDYGQQRVLEKLVNWTVVTALGGKESNAYKDIGKKVFSECNRDIKDHFNVNSRNNIPKLKFEEACAYIKKWQPCTNTKILIEDINAQLSIA